MTELNPTLTKILRDFGGIEAIKIAKVLVDADDETTDELIAEQSKIKLKSGKVCILFQASNHLCGSCRHP